MSLKFVSKGPINNFPALAHTMAWCRPDAKPISEPMMVSSPTHICVNELRTQDTYDVIPQKGGKTPMWLCPEFYTKAF